MAEELAQLLATGERAAFHGRPADGAGPLEQAMTLASARGLRAESAAARWLAGVCHGAAGAYGTALVRLAPLTGDGDVPRWDPPERAEEERLFASLAGATAASLQRQLGRHEVARAFDSYALTLATSSPEAAFDAHLGLAADAVGLADPDWARRSWNEASALVAERAEWWRQHVRLDWVAAEIALLEEDPPRALASATAALAVAERSGAPRHVAKSLLFIGVSQVQDGQDEVAQATLRRTSVLAESLGALPLLWPSRAMLATLVADQDLALAADLVASARTAVLAIAGDLPERLRPGWLARPDVAGLLEA
ncbi:MAG: hypothetical protein ACYCYA_09485 [Actinomycetes bacterium]